PGQGYATYRLKVHTQRNIEKLALKIPDMSTSCLIMIDQRTVASCGVVSADQEEAEARYKPQIVTFPIENEQFEIIVQVSNYLYDRGGMWYALNLGTEEQIKRLRENELSVSLILIGIFFFMG